MNEVPATYVLPEGGVLNINTSALERCEIMGDVMLTPRSWVTDALQARPLAIAVTAMALGAGLAMGVALVLLAMRLVVAVAERAVG